MRRRRFTGRRKSFVQRQEHIWTAVTVNNGGLSAGITQALPIVTGADWSVRAGYSTATLVRVRGWLCANTAASTAGQGAIFGTVQIMDAEDATPDVSGAANYIDEDILATFGGGITMYVGSEGNHQFPYFEIDVKARRKLRIDDTVYAFVRNVGGPPAELSGVLRALIVLK